MASSGSLYLTSVDKEDSCPSGHMVKLKTTPPVLLPGGCKRRREEGKREEGEESWVGGGVPLVSFLRFYQDS